MAAMAPDAVGMSGLETLLPHAQRAGARAVARRLEAMAAQLRSDFPDLVIARDGDALRLRGRGLARRAEDDARLRYAGRAGI